MAVWEKEGWGTTNDCLQMVVDNYKTQGTTDRHSVNALESYLRRLRRQPSKSCSSIAGQPQHR